jgi:hypothetical protein
MGNRRNKNKAPGVLTAGVKAHAASDSCSLVEFVCYAEAPDPMFGSLSRVLRAALVTNDLFRLPNNHTCRLNVFRSPFPRV